MTELDVTKEQAETLHEHLAPVSKYLHKLIERMSKRGFEQDDQLWKRVCAASRAMSDLNSRIVCLCNPGKMGIANGLEFQSSLQTKPEEDVHQYR